MLIFYEISIVKFLEKKKKRKEDKRIKSEKILCPSKSEQSNPALETSSGIWEKITIKFLESGSICKGFRHLIMLLMKLTLCQSNSSLWYLYNRYIMLFWFQIRSIPRPIDVPDSGLVCDLLWGDPAEVRLNGITTIHTRQFVPATICPRKQFYLQHLVHFKVCLSQLVPLLFVPFVPQ